MTDTSGIEFPDSAGYPDGEGTLDEGTEQSDPQAAAATGATTSDESASSVNEDGDEDGDGE